MYGGIDNGRINEKEVINSENLLKARIIKTEKNGLKILGTGDLKSKVAFEVSGASQKAIKSIEKTGSQIKIVGSPEENA